MPTNSLLANTFETEKPGRPPHRLQLIREPAPHTRETGSIRNHRCRPRPIAAAR